MNFRKSADIRVLGSCQSIRPTCVGRHALPVGPQLSKTAGFQNDLNAASLRDIVRNKPPDPTLHSPLEKQRYALSKPKSSKIINKKFQDTKIVLQITKPRDSHRALVSSVEDFAGKRSVPPRPTSHPADVPHYVGRPHAPNAYTPPWMKRQFSKGHAFPLTRPPDARASAKSS